MQFILNGPDVPTVLLEAHEEGRVVFFCGAGISYLAGLPGFQGLVDSIYSTIGERRSATEQTAYAACRYDLTLDLLERRVAGDRKAVRTALHQALQPKLSNKDATRTHEALLKLAKNREGITRLVTTNFDRIFAQLVASHAVFSFQAPLLPIPKVTRWNGLVYLHGLLPERPEPVELNRLVLTSGDFGLAYLTERWAARFVTELFRNYIICFVGYSIEDPVLRYLMDALAADRTFGEYTPLTYAFGPYWTDLANGKTESEAMADWAAKGVEPILYRVPADHSHAALHDTLAGWAATYEDGTLGKERIVVDHAIARPGGSTVQDDFVGRMLWALTDKSGVAAKRFADFDPAPSLEWLRVLSDERYGHHDLIRFGVPPYAKVDEQLSFSTLQRPSSYGHAPLMCIVSSGSQQPRWDNVMFQMGRWLVRHLNDPALVLWLAQRGGQLHERFAWLVEDALKNHAVLASHQDSEELLRFRAQSPNAIPRPWLKVVWELLLTGRLKSKQPSFALYRWLERFRTNGLTPALHLGLRDALAPKVVFSRTYRMAKAEMDVDAFDTSDEPLSWEVVLADDHAESNFHSAAKSEHWKHALPELLGDFQQLLLDALDLMRVLGGANDCDDRSYFDRPSISEHWQNRETHDWALLIVLVRDAWVEVDKNDPARSLRIADSWFFIRYPTFKRLALFAASTGRIPSNQWLQWLEEDDGWWLWAVQTRRESFRLIVLGGTRLSPADQNRLEIAILAGPPRSMFHDGMAADDWEELVAREIWLRLAKLRIALPVLGPAAATRLEALSLANPDWALAGNDRDEFSTWMSGSGDPDFEALRTFERAPRSRRGLAQWLVRPRPEGFLSPNDNWTEECRNRASRCFLALCDTAKEGYWPEHRWQTALSVWSGDTLAARSWKYAAALVYAMPEHAWDAALTSISRWLKSVSSHVGQNNDSFLNMCRRILVSRLPEYVKEEEPITGAINHPVGHIAEALSNLWFKTSPTDGALLSEPFEPFFSAFSSIKVPTFRHARVILATNAIALYRVDPDWSVRYLLPLFEWTNTREARAVWEGFLWAPRLYGPLMMALQSHFLDAVHHYSELGRPAQQQFVALLVHSALNGIDGFTREQFRHAVESLPQAGLDHAAKVVARALEAAGDQAETYWITRVKPFWQDLWPKSAALRSSSIAESAARLSMAAGNSFSEALAMMTPWLKGVEHPEYVVRLMIESHLAERLPVESLQLLDGIITDQAWCSPAVKACLDKISSAEPTLLKEPRYVRLAEFCKGRGG